MKKTVALLTVLVMLLSLCACKRSTIKMPEISLDMSGGHTSQTQESKPSSDPKPNDDGTFVETNFFTLSYGEEWTLDMEGNDYKNGEENAWVRIYLPDPEDSEKKLAYFKVSCYLNEPLDFSEYLINAGWDPQKVINGNEKPETRTIGGVDFWVYNSGSSVTYYGYLSDENAFYSINVSNTSYMDKADLLINSIEFTAQPYDGEVIPWFWNGTPYETTDHETMVGTTTIKSKAIPISESIVTWDIFSPRVAAAGGKVYVLVDDTLYQYAFDGNSLTLEKKLDVGDGYGCIQAADDGSIWLSDFTKPLLNVKDGAKVASYDDTDYVSMAPSGKWGISYFTSAECEKITINGATAEHETITFSELSVVSKVFVDENHIYVCGSAADESGHKVFVYDTNGKLQLTLADSDGSGVGSVTYVTETDNGFIALDGNMREVVLWTSDGTWVADIDDRDIFGTYYPWFAGSCLLDDGSILTLIVDEREDESADETIAFVLSGY